MSKRARQTQRQQFKKLPQELLAEALEQLQEQNGKLRQELWMRAAPRIAEMETALGYVVSAAENGDAKASALLHEFFNVWNRAATLGTGLNPTAVKPAKFEAPPGAEPGGEAIIQ